MLFFTSKYTKMRLAAERCTDPLEELTSLPKRRKWIKGRDKERGEGMEGRVEGRGSKGREVVSLNPHALTTSAYSFC